MNCRHFLPGLVLIVTSLTRLIGQDCNGNELEDALEIASGDASDCNGNGVPDECDLSPEVRFFDSLRIDLPRQGGRVAVGDADDDGLQDLISIESSSGNISLYFQESPREFSSGVRMPVFGLPIHTKVVDLNADGNSDIVVAGLPERGDPGGLSVFLGRGDRLFDLPENYPAGDSVRWFELLDYDHDGDLDALVANDRGTAMQILDGQGDGTFAAPRDFEIGVRSGHLDLADFNGDGLLDVYLSGARSSRIVVLLATESGFAEPVLVPASTEGSVLAFDYDRDGNLDFVSVSDERLNLARGDGAGGFETSGSSQVFSEPGILFEQDVDHDGVVDLMWSERNMIRSGAIVDGEFEPLVSYFTGVINGGFATSDLDGDGADDYIYGDYNPDRILVYFGTPRDEPELPVLSSVLCNGRGCVRRFSFVDIDHDGVDEIVSSGSSRTLWISEISSDGSIAPWDRFISLEGQGELTTAEFRDFNGDGLIDVFTHFDREERVFFHFGSKANNFDSFEEVRFRAESLGAALGDFNGDGLVDIAVHSSNDLGVRVRLRKADGSYAPVLKVAGAATSMRVIDLGGDGRDEIVTVRGIDDMLFVVSCDSQGIFSAPFEVPVGDAPESIEIADLDSDGNLDLLVSHAFPEIVVLLGDGEGGFKPRQFVPLDERRSGPAIGDLDGDGVPDLVMSTYETNLVLNGNGDGTFRRGSSFPANSLPNIFDYDGDGWLDLIYADYDSARVFVLTNRTQGTSPDCDRSGIPDECEIATGEVSDADGNGVPDRCQEDCDENGMPDDAELRTRDCDDNGRVDSCDIADGFLFDCDGSGVPDYCELLSGALRDIDGDGVPDSCEDDCDGDDLPDDLAIEIDLASDCDGNGVPDSCDFAGGGITDCDGNGVSDSCDVAPFFDLQGQELLDLSTSIPSAKFVDLEGDGDLDLIFLDRENLIVSRRRSSGRYGAVEQYPVSERIEAIGVGDFNGDGHPDVAAVEFRAKLSFFFGKGDGFLREPEVLELPLPEAFWIDELHVFDRNADGRDDLVFELNQGIYVSLTDDNGLPGPVSRLDHDADTFSVRTIDLNGDGVLDIVTLRRDAALVRAFLSDGDEFEPVNSALGFPQPGEATVGDFTGDGFGDLVVNDWQRERFVLLRGVGDGSFEHLRSTSVGPSGEPYQAFHWDGDGRADLIYRQTREGVDSFVLARATEEGSFESVTSEFPTLPLAVVDTNADGLLDLVNARSAVYERIPGAGFEVPLESTALTQARQLRVADIDADGHLDAAVGVFRAERILYGDGAGRLRGTDVIPGSFLASTLGDVDGNGTIDLVLTTDDDPYRILIYTRASERLFEDPLEIELPYRFFYLKAVDLNGDSYPDIIASDRYRSLIHLGTESGSDFVRSELNYSHDTREKPHFVDLDQDGVLDILLLLSRSERNSRIMFQRGRGDGTFRDAEFIPEIDAEASLEVADFNDDGIMDLLTPKSGVALGRGDASFMDPIPLPPRSYSWFEADIEVADMNGDGSVDVVGSFNERLFVLLGNGDGSFSEQVAYLVLAAHGSMELADLNEDGLLDVVAAGSHMTFLANTTSGFGHPDCNGNGVPDTCDLSSGVSVDVDGNAIPDECDLDCDEDDVPDALQIRTGESEDCDLNGVLDSCQIISGLSRDCNGNGVLDHCDGETESDCDENGVPDSCDLNDGAPDANANEILDVCEVVSCRVPGDCNEDGRLDLSDPICVLSTLFLSRPREFPCGDGSSANPGNLALLDWQGDGSIDLSDPIATMQFLFSGGPPHRFAVPGLERTECVPVFGCGAVR